MCSPPHLGLGDQRESAPPAHSANWAGASVPQERRGSRRHCPDGCWHGSSQEPGSGEQAVVTAGPPPCGEEPPDRARAHVLEKALGAGLGLSKEGGLGSEIRGIPAAPKAQHGGSPLPEPPTVGWGCVEGLPCTGSHPLLSQQAAGAEGCGAVLPTGTGDTPHLPQGTEHHRAPTPYPRTHRAGAVPSTQHSTPHHNTTQATAHPDSTTEEARTSLDLQSRRV